MMNKVFFGILLLGTLFGCGRSDPNGDSKETTVVPELKQIAVYQTAVPEPSGLVYNSKTNTLFTVSDGNGTVYEIDFSGNILRSFVIQSSDMEGIALSANCDTMYIAEETNQNISKYLINGTKLSSFPVNVATNPSHGPEGVTMGANNHIYVINEKTPCMLLEYLGSKEVYRKTIDYTIDCSDIFYDNTDSSIWLVSDESRQVIKMTSSGSLLKTYSVSFPKGEGIAIVQNKIYIINDSDNKLYVFEKPQ
jgi:uncharacterized protein YjiK